MQLYRISAQVVAFASFFLVAMPSQSASAQKIDAKQQGEETIQGVQLDPSQIGPGVIETWDDVLARDAQMPPGAANPKARNGRHGQWVVPEAPATFRPHSGLHNVVNEWGDTQMGIGFPRTADVAGAWFAGQAAEGVWPPAIRAVGYLNGQQVASTDWFSEISDTPKWFAMDLKGVDRIVIEAKPAMDGAAWYSMDDLTFTMVAANPGENPQQTVIDFEDCRWDQNLSRDTYKGLTWEEGTGSFQQAIPGPSRRIEPERTPITSGLPTSPGGVDSATTPTLAFNFQGPIAGGSFPPDTCGAAGPSHLITVVNTTFSVYRKSDGVRLVNTNLSSFFGGGSGDPRVLFDPSSQRWIVMDTDFSTRIFLAVSLTNDATGGFFKTFFTAGSGLDFPTLGVDQNGIYIGVLSGSSLSLIAIDKTPLVAPSPSMGTITTFTGLPFDGDIMPVLTYGTPSPVGEYCISRAGTSTMRLRRINPALPNFTLTNLTNISVASNSDPPSAPAQGSSTALDTGDTRLVNAIYRDGFIYTAHTINVSGRAGCRWYKINPSSSTVADFGTVSDPVRSYFYPSIAVNAFGDMVMGFSGSSPSQFAAAYYTGRAATDSAGEMATPVLLRAGNAAYNLVDNFGRNRWGDYSLTTLDPADNASMWTIQEYVHSTNTWGTHLGKLVINTPPTNDDCNSATTVIAGSIPFSTVFSSTDGPTECNVNGSSLIQNDIWYKFFAQCTGTATVSTCGASFDTKIAVYSSATCPSDPSTSIACSDDGSCGTAAEVSFPVTSGSIYKIRIGSRTGATGSGTMVISCMASGTPCPADITSDAVVNVNDLLAVINAWGSCSGCPADINHDGQVNVADMLAVINGWGACPP